MKYINFANLANKSNVDVWRNFPFGFSITSPHCSTRRSPCYRPQGGCALWVSIQQFLGALVHGKGAHGCPLFLAGVTRVPAEPCCCSGCWSPFLSLSCFSLLSPFCSPAVLSPPHVNYTVGNGCSMRFCSFSVLWCCSCFSGVRLGSSRDTS